MAGRVGGNYPLPKHAAQAIARVKKSWLLAWQVLLQAEKMGAVPPVHKKRVCQSRARKEKYLTMAELQDHMSLAWTAQDELDNAYVTCKQSMEKMSKELIKASFMSPSKLPKRAQGMPSPKSKSGKRPVVLSPSPPSKASPKSKSKKR